MLSAKDLSSDLKIPNIPNPQDNRNRRKIKF